MLLDTPRRSLVAGYIIISNPLPRQHHQQPLASAHRDLKLDDASGSSSARHRLHQQNTTPYCLYCRDLKLDNTLLDGSRPPRVKLCDFGFAKDFEPGQNLMTNIGWGSLGLTNRCTAYFTKRLRVRRFPMMPRQQCLWHRHP